MPGARYYDGKKLNISIPTQAGMELEERWITQGLSSIISAIAQNATKHFPEYYRTKIFKCSKSAETVFEQSECVFEIIDQAKAAPPNRAHRFDVLKSALGPSDVAFETDSNSPIKVWYPNKKQLEHLSQFRSKRDVIKSLNYNLKSETESLTPFGLIGKYFSKMLNTARGKDAKSWDSALQSLKRIQEKKENMKKIQKELKKRFKYAKYGANRLHKGSKLSEAEKTMIKEFGIPDEVSDRMKFGNNLDAKLIAETVSMFKAGVKLAAKLSGDNKTAEAIDKKKLMLGSPRVLSVAPEDNENDVINLLSPSMLSLHDEGTGIEKALSIPNLMNTMNNTDYKEWLKLIMDASGVSDTISKLDSDNDDAKYPIPYKSFPRGIDGQPMYFTKTNVSDIGGDKAVAKVEIFEEIQRLLNDKQVDDFNSVGFSILNDKQLDFVYGNNSPFRNEKALKLFQSLSEEEILNRVVSNLRQLGKVKKMRHKRNVLSPAVLQALIVTLNLNFNPFILSPVLLTAAVLAPCIFGPVILSPWLFVPLILSPRMFAPVVLSPVALSCLILTPLVMDPLILSPAALVAFILSPNVLSPNILTPTVMCPSVLSPFALSPNVFSPAALTVVAFSPFVLSPNYFSPAYCATLLAAPHAFSPNINSTGKGVTLLFSPSAFS